MGAERKSVRPPKCFSIKPALSSCTNPRAAAVAAAVACAHRLQALYDFEAFAEALKMYDFAFTQKIQRLEYLAVIGHIDQMLVSRAGFLLWHDFVRTTFFLFQEKKKEPKKKPMGLW